jgi:hypothetical protein
LDVNPAIAGRLKIGNIAGDRLLAKALSLYAGLD